MLSFLVPGFAGFQHIFRFSHIFNADVLGRHREIQSLGNGDHHTIRCAQDKHPFGVDFLEGRPHFIPLLFIPKNGSPHCFKTTFFPLGRFPCHNAAVIDKNAVINNTGRLIFISNHKRPITFPCTRRPVKSDYFHSPAPFIISFSHYTMGI